MENLLTTDACTLPTVDQGVRLAEFDSLCASAVRAVERRGLSVRLHLTGGAGLRDRVPDLVARESSCCSFFTFAVDGTDDDLVLDVSVPPEREDILEALVERARRLSA